MSGALKNVLTEIRAERARQDRKWGADRNQPAPVWHTILSEEVGECAECVLEKDMQAHRAELIHVAAVAVATAEAIDRENSVPLRPEQVYLSGPIAGCSDDECKVWREQAKRLHQFCVDPMVRDFRDRSFVDVAEVVEGDKRDIDNCDALVVWYDRQSSGTAMEILYAWERGIPIYVVNRKAVMSPWIEYHATAVVSTLEEAFARIKGGAQ